MKKLKLVGKGIGLVLLILLALGIWQRELVAYGWLQLNGQLRVMREAKSFELLKNEASFPDSLKSKIDLIEQARHFGEEEIGMKLSKNYTKIYDQKGKHILWNVTAAQPYALEAYEWTFPIVGSFSYRGYFDLEKAQVEAQQLDQKGLDTDIYPVSAWSTLGWFEDVLLSKNLERSEGDLAELILHELTHATLYIKDSVDFNENLANFVGEEGAKLFLIKEYGKESLLYKQYVNELADSKKYRNFMLKASQSLDSMYQSERFKKLALQDKSFAKNYFFETLKQRIDTVSFADSAMIIYFKEKQLNNTDFMSIKRYNQHQDTLSIIFQTQFQSDLRAFLKYFAEKHPSSLNE